MRKWGFGIIGCGSIADFHVAALKEIENAELIAVSSRTEEKAKNFAADHNCDWSSNYHDLLNNPDIDIICVTSSSGSHGEIGIEAVKAKKHVFVEKPITMTVDEAEEMIQIAKENQVTLGVVSQRRFEDNIQAIKRVVEEGSLGKLLFVECSTPFYRSQEYYDSADWRGTIAEDGGALMNQGIHQIDLLLWLGGRAKSVYGKIATQTHEMEAEDLGLAIVSFENGALGTIMSSTSIKPGFQPVVNVYGEKGSIKLEGKAITEWNVPSVEKPVDTEDASNQRSGTSNPRDISHDFHKRQMIDLIAAIENGNDPVCKGEDGKHAVEVIHAIYEASKSGKEVTFN